jgi:small GTP-binding protein
MIISLFERLFPRGKFRVLMIGLEGSGRTTILYRKLLGNGAKLSVIPTVGFNVETIKFNNVDLEVWDVRGGYHCRPQWRHYYPNTHGLVFVVDSSDRFNLDCQNERESAQQMLHSVLSEEELIGVVVLIFFTKQDLSNICSSDELKEKLQLNMLQGHNIHCQTCCGLTGEGLKEGFDWLNSALLMKAV